MIQGNDASSELATHMKQQYLVRPRSCVVDDAVHRSSSNKLRSKLVNDYDDSCLPLLDSWKQSVFLLLYFTNVQSKSTKKSNLRDVNKSFETNVLFASDLPFARPTLVVAAGSATLASSEARHRGRRFRWFTPRKRVRGEQGPRALNISSGPMTGASQAPSGGEQRSEASIHDSPRTIEGPHQTSLSLNRRRERLRKWSHVAVEACRDAHQVLGQNATPTMNEFRQT